MKPLIGINMDVKEVSGSLVFSLQSSYCEAIVAAGGIPVPLQPMDDTNLLQRLSTLKGLLLSGGLDYCPSTYGEETSDKVQLIHPVRQEFDLRLIKMALSMPTLPVLGICAGHQLIAIGTGGKLHKDIQTDLPESTVRHSANGSWTEDPVAHTVSFVAGCRLAAIYGSTKITTPTSHHQAASEPGQLLVVCGRADDNVIEAIELTGQRFVVGVQYHPERALADHMPLFVAFIEQALVMDAQS